MFMRSSGNGDEVIVFHRTADGEETGYTVYPTERAALGSSGYDWRDPDQDLKAEDPTIVKVAPREPVTATPIGNATHDQRHARS
jgi:hypothetical protein